MKYAAAVILAFTLVACTPAQDEQAHRNADQAKREAKEALHKAEVETRKLDKEVDSGMEKAREKTRKALGAEPDKDPR
jgi:Ni/Co efflux regulator RcnB